MSRPLLAVGVALAVGMLAALSYVRSDVSVEVVVPAAAKPHPALVLVEPSRAPELPRVASSQPAKLTPSEALSRAEVELVALEEEALRRIDVVPVLEAAGVDLKALRARADAADVLRHVAGEEVLTRGYMREYFTAQIYPYGYPVDRALRDARQAAEGQVAELDTQARVESLRLDLESDASDVPQPEVYPKESGRIYADSTEPATDEDKPDTH